MSEIKIEPQPGPQEAFLSTVADIAIYGGAAGGGKTYALLIEPLRHLENPKFGGVVFRKQSKQIRNQGGLWDESVGIYLPLGARPRESYLEWQFPSGMQMQFDHLENDMAVYKWQGSQIPLICCEENEKVKTKEDLKSLKEIKVGDYVLTLQGLRKVLWVGARRLEECVEIKSGDLKQVHSTTHKILTPEGWFSYEDVLTAYERDLASNRTSIQSNFFSRYDGYFREKCQGFLQLFDSLQKYLQPKLSPYRSILGHLILPGFFSYKAPQDLHTDFVSSRYASQLHERLPSVRLVAVRFLQFPDSLPRASFHAQVEHECVGVQHELNTANSQCSYLAYSHRYGEFAYRILKRIQCAFQTLVGAALRIRKSSPLDGRDIAPSDTRHGLRYVHPYRGYEQTAEVEYCHVPCELRPCGKKWVIDITVESESHYVTENGFINKNCFDELTHFSARQFFYMLSRNRSTSKVPGYIRATCNPDADSWVRGFIDWWIDEYGYAIPSRGGKIRWFIRRDESLIWADSREELIKKFGPEEIPKSVTFIPSSVHDNRILMENDPSYIANLRALSKVDRERLEKGNWNIKESAGTIFRREWFPVIEAIPAGWVASVRFWDRAATKPHEGNRDPDWTRGLKLLKYADGTFIVADLKSIRDTPGQVEKLIKNVATHDGIPVKIMSQQDPGSAGVEEAENFIRMLAGFWVETVVMSKDKVTRAKPVSAQAEAGNIRILRAPWNEEFFKELDNFPDGAHDDIVDTLSGAFNQLAVGLSILDVYQNL